MQHEERELLLVEFEQAWSMILNIDERRFKFVEYFTTVFTAIVTVGTALLTWHGTVDATVAAPLTVLIVLGILSGLTFKAMLESERRSNLRYRKKINLIRERFLYEGDRSEPRIADYFDTDERDLGIKSFHHHPQPEGVGRTLGGVYRFLSLQIGVLALSIVALWVAAILNS